MCCVDQLNPQSVFRVDRLLSGGVRSEGRGTLRIGREGRRPLRGYSAPRRSGRDALLSCVAADGRHVPMPAFARIVLTVPRCGPASTSVCWRSLRSPDIQSTGENPALTRTQIGNHTFRATGITEYLRNGGKLEIAQRMANHESARTTGLYDRREDDVSLDEVERILI